MDARDFDDDRRVIQRAKTVVLHDGREFSHKQIFEEFLKDGFKSDYMKEAMYLLILHTPISIVSETKDSEGMTIDIEKYFRKKGKGNREKYTPVTFKINGLDSNDDHFYDELERNGEVFSLT